MHACRHHRADNQRGRGRDDGTAKVRSDISGDMEKTDRFILEAPLATVRRFLTTMMDADIFRHPFAMQVLYDHLLSATSPPLIKWLT